MLRSAGSEAMAVWIQRNQQRSLEVERAAVLARRAGWEEGQRRLADLQRWCHRVSARLGELTYEQKRLALEALGVEIRVWKAGPRAPLHDHGSA